MRKTFLTIFTACGLLAAFAQPTANGISIIPAPVSLTPGQGSFTLPKTIAIESGVQQSQAITDLQTHLTAATGYKVVLAKSGMPATIHLTLNKSVNTTLGDEGYDLSVAATGITIKANKPAGLFYGVQTLLQLLPKEIESRTVVKGVAWQVPFVTIRDYPRFGWRGLMLDVSRHFFTKQEVKDFIDEMVKYKYNLLHWHLTDDQGWRIEIKALPKLTEVGAWNAKREGRFGTFSAPAADEPRNYGGFYTQDDIKEMVQYAAARFVDILPEVDIPGHSLAAIAAYPELSCTEGADKYRVNSGDKFMNWYPGGFSAIIDNTLCPANEKVYPFLDKVFTEVAALFPFGYIHVGGDECAKNFWEKSDAIRQLMQKENLKNMQEVQSYFEKRVEKIVESKGKKVIGWDEILEGGLAPNAAVMSWRGIKGGIEAAKQGHQVVMSPTTFVYLDYMQGDAIIEPPVYATLRLNTAYSFEPVPDGVDPSLIKGGQANLWTEQVYNTRHLQYMIWPRSLAVAECLWSPKEKKSWTDFVRRTEATFQRMDIQQIKYARSLYDVAFTAKKDPSASDSLSIGLSTEVPGLDIYYSFDNSNPDSFYPKYAHPLTVPKDADMLKVITYRDGRPIGRQLDMPINELKRRAGLKDKPVPPAE
ncbi:family 20 glycosylhydrolase [Flavitalea sp. BT771]|uniref:beta-N-acetylhexosaminidase n=1 Tax=Flavitalea sp. BT771 TaxID=3063329 RepID=UPI0026E2A982|nr:family 20 glycosylhydrolase [Flavitalea sp. BT771]MDO6433324.1 family 20 glycosylhydrolase [Flavitalea sp. BT771]MDV6222771.1 family 20 glycosylhydrolase [Flavitalea sp. BT771]